MRIKLIGGSAAVILAALVSSAAPSQAYVPQPRCSDGTGNESGAPICGYSSYQQCVANAGPCVANPAIDPLPTVPGSTIFMLARPVYHRSRRG
jgi:Protein of unknown function (DUF3551)